MKRTTAEQLLGALRLIDNEVTANARVSWTDADIQGVRALLLFEGAELWLYRQVQRGRINVPDALKSDLRTAAHRISVINMRVDAQTIAVTNLLRTESIPWVLMKGQARRAAVAIYPFADARLVSDVDLLLPEAQAKSAWQLLCIQGFRRVFTGDVAWSADHHLPALIDDSNVSVELHTTTMMSVPPAEAWHRLAENGDEVQWNGIVTHVPNATELVWQALSHGAADASEGYTLKAFLSVAAILAVNDNIDWPLIHGRVWNSETLDAVTQQPVPRELLKNFLDISAGLAGIAVPPVLAARPRARIVPLLVWRAWVLSSSLPKALQGRMLEESTRVEVWQPISPFVSGAGAYRNLRRRISSIIARTAYVLWRRFAN